MDYQRFIQQLPGLYKNWGQKSVHPKSEQFQAVLDQVKGMTAANVMQLLNLAVECMETDDVYCEIGCFPGATLIGALLNHPELIAYAVDNFSEADASQDNFEQLSKNLSVFNLDEQVVFCNQNFEEFFFDLRENQNSEKIGVYFYDGAPDYRSQLLALLLVKPFLAEQALIVINGSNWSTVQQAAWDFMAAHSQCQLTLDLSTAKDDYTFGKGIFVLSWDIKNKSTCDWPSFAANCRNEPIIKAIYNFSSDFEFSEKKKVVNILTQEALKLHHLGQFLEAEQKYLEILNWDRNNANAWHNLGIVYYNLEQYEESLSMLLRAIEIKPSEPAYYYSLGLVQEEVGNNFQAFEAYQTAITLNPEFVDAYNNLGKILSTAGEFEQAELICRQAIAANPKHFGSYLNLGNVLMARHQIDAAIEVYKKSLELKQRDPNIIYNLGLAFEAKDDPVQAAFYFGYAAYRSGKFAEAILKFQKFLEHQKGDAYLYMVLADCHQNTNQQEETLKAYQEGIKHYPTDAELYLRLSMTLQDWGRVEEAIAVANEASQLLPNNLALQREKQRLLPIIYDTPEEIDFYRCRFAQYLDDLIQQTSLDSLESKKTALQGAGFTTNFYLHYQGKNDLKLQSRYGQLVHKVMAANYPEWAQPLSIPPVFAGEKIRVGYISAHLRSHSGTTWALGWLKNHKRQEFKIYCYHAGIHSDSITQQFRLYSDAFYHVPEDLEPMCQQIINDKLHILVFTDIGLAPHITQMAALRLAPVQCTAWGHPITSGLPTIDYYLSSELMEPENAEEHYSEKLIRLPNIGICYSKPNLPQTQKKRSEFKLHDDAVVYLSCQSSFKYLPQYDYIFAAIAQQVPQAQIVFAESPRNKYITDKFWHRLQKAFASLGLRAEEHCLVLPRLEFKEYLQLLLISDVFLDTFSFSGGHTTMQAIACNLPVVTCPGEFMRGRQSYGMLKMLGVTETIANNEAEYIEIAVRLGLNREWRNKIAQKMEERHSYLYDDTTCVTALEEFYRRVVSECQ